MPVFAAGGLKSPWSPFDQGGAAAPVELVSSRIEQRSLRVKHQPPMGNDPVVIRQEPAGPVSGSWGHRFNVLPDSDHDRWLTAGCQSLMPHGAGPETVVDTTPEGSRNRLSLLLDGSSDISLKTALDHAARIRILGVGEFGER